MNSDYEISAPLAELLTSQTEEITNYKWVFDTTHPFLQPEDFS